MPECCLRNSTLCLIWWSLIALVAEILILSFFIKDCGDLFESGNYPFISAGLHAKGFIAIGVVSRGIISFGIVSQGLLSVSMMGSGIIAFVGLWGGTLGIGIYQLGVSSYCYLGQLSISIVSSRSVQLGINIIGPLCNKQKPRVFASIHSEIKI